VSEWSVVVSHVVV